MPRPTKPKVCLEPGCAEMRPCPQHHIGPWSDSAHKARMPRNWPQLRTATLNRAGHRCQIHGPTCTITATIVDPIVPGAFGGSDRLENLQAVCKPCHDVKSKAESAEGRRRAREERR